MKKNYLKPVVFFLMTACCASIALTGCGSRENQSILIYSSSADHSIELLIQRLEEKFPDYAITVEYLPTGNHAAKLLSEGLNTKCDIIYDLDYAYLQQLDDQGYLADLSSYDKSVYVEDTVTGGNYVPSARYGGGIIVDTDALNERGIPEPTCYQDLLDPAYKGLITWADPKVSGTGYMFLDSLVNEWGEEKAFAYFDQLAENVNQFAASGNAPINSVLQKEAILGVGNSVMISKRMNENYPVKLLIFDEGSPFVLNGSAMIKGKDTRPEVKAVFDYMVNEFIDENCALYAPEKIYKDKDYKLNNLPDPVHYANMSPNTAEHRDSLLEKWTH